MRNRRGGNLHDSLREFVNSIMNNLFMTSEPLEMMFCLDVEPDCMIRGHCNDHVIILLQKMCWIGRL